jgi:benzil reductase ((S)-benzoin forming)
MGTQREYWIPMDSADRPRERREEAATVGFLGAHFGASLSAMPGKLVFITGASSGIGLALARAAPRGPVRIIDISRRGTDACEHFAADLADPASWSRVAQLFESEIQAFAGDRVVFIHSAGTLQPMGFAGEVDGEAYARNVLLNSAAPQVLGAAFLRAVRGCKARSDLVMISSGAAESIYEGWTAYGAGKAAVNQWVRIAGAEQIRRGGRCHILAIAPGVVATAMQEEIREMPEDRFPEVAKFVALHEAGELREPSTVAREIWDLVLGGTANGAVLDLRDKGDR